MKRVLAFLLALPLAAALGLFLYGWWHDRGFFKDHPPPGRFHASAHAIDALGQEPPPPPPVVFIHGNPGSCLDFEPVMQQLSPQLRSYAFDRPGYGWSPRPEPVMGPRAQARFLHDAIRELGLVKPVIAGFSYGGPVALAYALDYPDDVSALVLIAALGNPDEKHAMGGSQALLLEPYGPPIAWALGSLLAPDAVSEGYTEAFFPKPADPAVVERGRWLFSRPGALLASARDWRVLETELPLLAARYGTLHLPVEILSANQDRIVGGKHAEYLAAHLAGAHRVDVDDAGHQLMSSHTAQVAAAVQRAVARVSP